MVVVVVLPHRCSGIGLIRIFVISFAFLRSIASSIAFERDARVTSGGAFEREGKVEGIEWLCSCGDVVLIFELCLCLCLRLHGNVGGGGGGGGVL